MPGEVERKYGGLLEKKWTSVIRLQKKVAFSLPNLKNIFSIRTYKNSIDLLRRIS